MTPNTTLVGIDPGRNTGLAIRYPDGTHKLLTLDFWRTVFQIQKLKATCKESGIKLIVYIEDPNLNKPTFLKAGVQNHASNTRISQNIGQNKKEAELLIQYCRISGINVIAVKPTTSKWSAKEFKLYTKIEDRCSQHAKDAYKLISGR